MIDIHVIVMPDSNQAWLERCLKSLEHPLVSVYIVDGVEGHVGKGRASGYQQGTQRFVAHVDPDDYLLDEAIDRLLPWLEQYPAITTQEIILNEDGGDTGKKRIGHQLTVYSRELITPKLIHCMSCTERASELFVRQIIQPKRLPVLTYAYRIRSDGSHTKHSPQLLVERKQWLDAERDWGGA